jgi:hypothetical protein
LHRASGFSFSKSARSNQGLRDGAITSEVRKLDGVAAAQAVPLIRPGDAVATSGFVPHLDFTPIARNPQPMRSRLFRAEPRTSAPTSP